MFFAPRHLVWPRACANTGRLVWTLCLTLSLGPTLAGIPQSDDRAWLNDVTQSSGLDFVHDPGEGSEYFMPAIMGSGAALVDFDGDGDLDIYLIQAKNDRDPSRPGNRLFRQDANMKFQDITDAAGVGDTGYGMGVAIGDVDNDGHVDLYVTNYGPDVLYRNLGNAKFEDITRASGVSGDLWSASAVFCDYDGDGYLDLYVTHYVDYDPGTPCSAHDGAPEYCSPQVFEGLPDTLYHNNGDSTFRDVSATAGLDRVHAPGLGVICQDFTGDARPDFYVANDGESNQLWMNEGNDRFVDEAFMLGAALNAFGKEEAGMGVAAGDLDEDGDLDLFLTHLKGQSNTLYLNAGERGFEDGTIAAGLGISALATTGFGTALLDIDHDGHLDLAIANGRVTREEPRGNTSRSDFWVHYSEANLVYRNTGANTGLDFEDVGESAGAFASRLEVSRGLAVGDIEADGDMDLLLSNAAGPARLFINDAPKQGRWLVVRAFDPENRRDAYGAMVMVSIRGRDIVRLANPGFSYLSSSDVRAHFGLPAIGAIDSIRIQWPGGFEERFSGVDADQAITLERGSGAPIP